VTIHEPTAEQKATLKELAKPTYDWWIKEVCPKYGAEVLAAIEESQAHNEFKDFVPYWYTVK
jgi:hypothetical protein